MYNEPYSQIMESLAGLYRAYYELLKYDKEYEGRVSIVLVADGIENVTAEFRESLARAGMYK